VWKTRIRLLKVESDGERRLSYGCHHSREQAKLGLTDEMEDSLNLMTAFLWQCPAILAFILDFTWYIINNCGTGTARKL
jgi:hypothetical protein